MKKTRILISIFLVVVCLFIIDENESQAELIAYDADGQFLGVVMSSVDWEFYHPAYDIHYQIEMRNGEVYSKNTLYFKDEDCIGTPYVKVRFPNVLVSVDERYYLTDNVVPSTFQPKSRLYDLWPTCTNASHSEWTMLPVYEISSPIKFPVALPLKTSFEPIHPGKWKK